MVKLRNKASWSQWVLMPLRLIIGFGFMAQGWTELCRGPSGYAKLLTQIGAPLPETTAWVSTFVELLGRSGDFRGGVRRGRKCSAHRHDARGDVHRAPEDGFAPSTRSDSL